MSLHYVNFLGSPPSIWRRWNGAYNSSLLSLEELGRSCELISSVAAQRGTILRSEDVFERQLGIQANRLFGITSPSCTRVRPSFDFI